MDFAELKGKVLLEVDGAAKGSELVELMDSEGLVYAMLHLQDCCETVEVRRVLGDVRNLIGRKILEAVEHRYDDDEMPQGEKAWRCMDSWTFTDFTLKTDRGTVVIRWLGESNGYYSEDVEFIAPNLPKED